MRTTLLYDAYKDSQGVKLTDFGGWDLPVNFANGIIAEHNAVRSSAGMFDVSHMGECMVSGKNAMAFLDSMVTNDVSQINPGKAMYAIMCYENGTCVDDLIIYCISLEKFFVVMNASNVEKDLAWLRAHCTQDVNIEDLSAVTAQIAVQGPKAVEYMKVFFPGIENEGFFCFKPDAVYKGFPCIVGRTGYTGEDGFEIYTCADCAKIIWKELDNMGVEKCGLGARDSLRLEAKLPLYGHEISDSITPLEANLNTFVKLDKKATFIGKDALIASVNNGIGRSLRGFEMIEGGVARNGYPVFVNGKEVGYVTSGTKSPTCDKFVGYALMERNLGLKFGDEIGVLIHGKIRKAMLCRTPFYKTTGKKSSTV